MYKRHIINALLTTLLLAAFSATTYLYIELREARELASTNQSISPEEVSKLTDEISKFMRLPTNETPTILTVNNVDELKKQQQFFEHALNGDKVLIYQQNRRAILYRPSQKKVIEVTPIAFNSTNQQTQSGQEEINPPQPQVASAQSNNQQTNEQLEVTVINGTQDIQQTSLLIEKIRASNNNLNIKQGGNTNSQLTQTTIVLKESANRQERALAQDLSLALNAKVESSIENEPIIQQASSNLIVIAGATE